MSSTYTDCMTQEMRAFPKGISREERAALFCISAKICSGKFTDRAEAAKFCQEHPGEKKAPGVKRGQACFAKVDEIFDCLTAKGVVSKETLSDCMCGKPKVSKATKAQQMWEAMPPEQKEALQMMAMMGQEYGSNTFSTESKNPMAKN
jgi:hypothetical protein